jgi:hypothetical protein
LSTSQTHFLHFEDGFEPGILDLPQCERAMEMELGPGLRPRLAVLDTVLTPRVCGGSNGRQCGLPLGSEARPPEVHGLKPSSQPQQIHGAEVDVGWGEQWLDNCASWSGWQGISFDLLLPFWFSLVTRETLATVWSEPGYRCEMGWLYYVCDQSQSQGRCGTAFV